MVEKLWQGHLSPRERNWLWICLKFFPTVRPNRLDTYPGERVVPMSITPSSFTEEGQFGEMYQLLSRNNAAINPLKIEKIFNSQDDFAWIENDIRQLRWLIEQIQRALNFGIPDARARLGDRDYFICLLDVATVPLHVKKGYLEQLRRIWLENLKTTSYLNWFDDEEFERCEFAFQSLAPRMMGYLGFGPDKFSSGTEIKSYFDFLQISSYEKKSHIDHVKKLWSQKVYRKRLEKAKVRQRNFVLPETTIKSLENVAKKAGLSRTKVLEQLIYFADKYGMPAEQSPVPPPGAQGIPKREFQQPS
ncbi:hypothetical protein AB1286_14090 [Trinickia sp. NRRL B-1857]|uniref:hypothetical protein n=1 Tax=Trinickia sp. NRRL B-1857 TaxID=3162879 RepID=UPI003D276CB0